MQRESVTPRNDWQERLKAQGFSYAGEGENAYWTEDACYHLTPKDAEVLTAAAQEVERLYFQAAEHVIRNGLWAQVGIPAEYGEYIKTTWERGDLPLQGRFDFSYDGVNPPKLLEFNADVAASQIETGPVQADWLQTQKPGAAQINDLHNALVDSWRQMRDERPDLSRVCFAYNHGAVEDTANAEYVRLTAKEAGLETSDIDFADIGVDLSDDTYVDADSVPIECMYKVYPWNLLARDEFGNAAKADHTQFVEPAWKMIFASKGLLPILHELNPGHPNLLPAFRSAAEAGPSYVEKPMFSWSGNGVSIITPQFTESAAPAPIQDGESIYQAYHDAGSYDGWRPVVGVWTVGNKVAGLGIRETRSHITDDSARFTPHYIA